MACHRYNRTAPGSWLADSYADLANIVAGHGDEVYVEDQATWYKYSISGGWISGSGAVSHSTPTAITTAGNVTYSVDQVLGGLISRDPNGADRTDVLPTAAQLAAAVPGVQIGTSFQLGILNSGDTPGENITVTLGSGLTEVPESLVSAGNAITSWLMATLYFVFTNVTSGQEAATVYVEI